MVLGAPDSAPTLGQTLRSVCGSPVVCFWGWAGGGTAGSGRSGRAACTYLPIELLHVFQAPHNHMAVYHLGLEDSEVLLGTTVLTARDGQGRLITLLHSSLPLWGAEQRLCHLPKWLFLQDCKRLKEASQSVTTPTRKASACVPRLRKTSRPVRKTKYSKETKRRRFWLEQYKPHSPRGPR